jgi:hypothetical protein
MIVYRCDVCNEIRECEQKDISDKEYDICSECWKALLAKLVGKGRSKGAHEFVTLPIQQPLPESPQEPRPPSPPGAPPTIYGSAALVN